jgi:hypothetical protein
MDMPSACVWQTAASQLWLNQLVGAVNATHPGETTTSYASPELVELCSCQPKTFRWEVGSWSQCFRDPSSSCGERMRSRHVFCIRTGMQGMNRSGDVVGDLYCASLEPPAKSEMCTGCIEDVVRAVAEFTVASSVIGLTSRGFEDACYQNFIAAMDPLAPSLRVQVSSCCETPMLRADLFVSSSSHINLGMPWSGCCVSFGLLWTVSASNGHHLSALWLSSCRFASLVCIHGILMESGVIVAPCVVEACRDV